MQDFSTVLKVLLEKRLTPTVAALVSGALIYAFSSENNWLLIKLGKIGYGLVWAGIVFLVLTCIQTLTYYIRHWLSVYKDYAEDKEYEKKQMREAVENIWTFMDELQAEEISFIREFTRNGNQVIEKTTDFLYGYLQQKYFNHNPIIFLRLVKHGDETFVQYRLDKSFYELLMYSLKTYNRINHFE
ncbi:hypothetical protein [Butyrivibrio sp. LB2008]|uniref:hypothetical protein n=1 Tax=Butyrivibrio sp. LB2008 TaxID=1408305 RepID=UPI00047B822D|nr:hypothetical protein [Butyrivibrio sp. LB2008]